MRKNNFLIGKIKVDNKTKNLVKRIKPHEIAVINHEDLDELAAISLIKAKVKFVINANLSMTGKYPNLGPLTLLKNNIPLLDNVGSSIMELKDGLIIKIYENTIYVNDNMYATGTRQTLKSLQEILKNSKKNIKNNLDDFIDNTLFNANLEKNLILDNLTVPNLNTKIMGKHTLIVVRGQGYQEDLGTIKSYINDIKPVLVGVDGGADALRECGYIPDIIIGDMDSITDSSLKCGAELVVHAYSNGFAPGMQRVKELGLNANTFAVQGTSEDAAMLLAYHYETELIVAVGTHTNMIDFLEKGRLGMASTLLTRIMIGKILVDAKGVSKLYSKRINFKSVFNIVIAAFVPFIVIASTSTIFSQLGRLLLLKAKLFLGF
ncbi:MAG: putative cytokinetic ring protein SteA [Clostridia bacterium]|nr:putative cytokinetic ring protein SteA [Clostridia bacterium]MDD4047838.1 putative cytokinetic ring protein SteA [Clostridia bacterium]